MILYKKVCSDIVKCIQVIHPDSVLYRIYENAVGSENMKVLSSFKNLAMYNFGVRVVKEMEEGERQYLEQNIQIALSQKEIDLEDAIAVRQLKDINQAERLLVVRRKKRIMMNQQIAMQNSQQQAQIQQQSAMASSQARQQEMQMEAQLKSQEMQMRAQMEAQLEGVKHEFRKEIELIKAQATLGFKEDDENFKQKLEVLKEDRKDDRVKKQAVEQSKLISQRSGVRGELSDQSSSNQTQILP
jgi:CO dehydrogenase/acetyl-CoA synthase beta subunit